MLAPHPDDETLGCGGTILLHRQAGGVVRVLIVTDGRASRAGGLGPDEMARRREGEARHAMASLGVELVWLGLPEAGWSEAALREPLAAELAFARLIYAPSPIDYHPEHVRVARALAELVVSQPVRVYELGVPLGPSLTNLVAETTAEEPRRQAALAAYASQLEGNAKLDRLRRYAGCYWFWGGLAEPFWELSPAAYRAVVAAADWSSASPFRGLRGRAFGDPLSYLAGWLARRHLAAAASGH